MDDLLQFVRHEVAMDGDDGTPIDRLDSFLHTFYARAADSAASSKTSNIISQNIDDSFKDFVWKQLALLPELTVAFLRKVGTGNAPATLTPDAGANGATPAAGDDNTGISSTPVPAPIASTSTALLDDNGNPIDQSTSNSTNKAKMKAALKPDLTRRRDARLGGDEYEFVEISQEEIQTSTRDRLQEKYGSTLRIAADPETCYVALTGSHERFGKLTPLTYQVLQAIAKGREDGKTVIDLGKEFTHDQKSLFHFVKSLCELDLIVKIKILVVGSQTSRCIHRHYLQTSRHWATWMDKDPNEVAAKADVDEDDMSKSTPLMFMTVAHINSNEPFVRSRIINAIKLSPGKLLPITDLVYAIGFQSKPSKEHRRRVNRIVANLVREGLVEKTRIARLGAKGLLSCLRLPQSSRPSQQEQIDISEPALNDEHGIEERPNVLTTLPIERQVIDLLASAGHQGLTIRELQVGLGDVGLRSLETLLIRVEKMTEPPHLCDYRIHSVFETQGRQKRLRYFTMAGYHERCRQDGVMELVNQSDFTHPELAGGFSFIDRSEFYATPQEFAARAKSLMTNPRSKATGKPKGRPRTRRDPSQPAKKGRPRGSTKAAKVAALAGANGETPVLPDGTSAADEGPEKKRQAADTRPEGARVPKKVAKPKKPKKDQPSNGQGQIPGPTGTTELSIQEGNKATDVGTSGPPAAKPKRTYKTKKSKATAEAVSAARSENLLPATDAVSHTAADKVSIDEGLIIDSPQSVATQSGELGMDDGHASTSSHPMKRSRLSSVHEGIPGDSISMNEDTVNADELVDDGDFTEGRSHGEFQDAASAERKELLLSRRATDTEPPAKKKRGNKQGPAAASLNPTGAAANLPTPLLESQAPSVSSMKSLGLALQHRDMLHTSQVARVSNIVDTGAELNQATTPSSTPATKKRGRPRKNIAKDGPIPKPQMSLPVTMAPRVHNPGDTETGDADGPGARHSKRPKITTSVPELPVSEPDGSRLSRSNTEDTVKIEYPPPAPVEDGGLTIIPQLHEHEHNADQRLLSATQPVLMPSTSANTITPVEKLHRPQLDLIHDNYTSVNTITPVEKLPRPQLDLIHDNYWSPAACAVVLDGDVNFATDVGDNATTPTEEAIAPPENGTSPEAPECLGDMEPRRETIAPPENGTSPEAPECLGDMEPRRETIAPPENGTLPEPPECLGDMGPCSTEPDAAVLQAEDTNRENEPIQSQEGSLRLPAQTAPIDTAGALTTPIQSPSMPDASHGTAEDTAVQIEQDHFAITPSVLAIPAEVETIQEKVRQRRNHSMRVHENEYMAILKEVGGVVEEGFPLTKAWQSYMQRKDPNNKKPRPLDRRTMKIVASSLEKRGLIKRSILQFQNLDGKMLQRPVMYLPSITLDSQTMKDFAVTMQESLGDILTVPRGWLSGGKDVDKTAEVPHHEKRMQPATDEVPNEARPFFLKSWRIVAQHFGWQCGFLARARTLHEYLISSITDDNDSAFIISSNLNMRIFSAPFLLLDTPLSVYLRIRAVSEYSEELEAFLKEEGAPETAVKHIPAGLSGLFGSPKVKGYNRFSTLFAALMVLKLLVPLEQVDHETHIVAYSGTEREPRYFAVREDARGATYWLVPNQAPVYDMQEKDAKHQRLLGQLPLSTPQDASHYWDTVKGLTFGTADTSDLLPVTLKYPPTLNAPSSMIFSARSYWHWRSRYLLFSQQKTYLRRILDEAPSKDILITDIEKLKQIAHNICAPLEAVQAYYAKPHQGARPEWAKRRSRKANKKQTRDESCTSASEADDPRAPVPRSRRTNHATSWQDWEVTDEAARLKQQQQIIAMKARGSLEAKEAIWEGLLNGFRLQYGEEAVENPIVAYIHTWFMAPDGPPASEAQKQLEQTVKGDQSDLTVIPSKYTTSGTVVNTANGIQNLRMHLRSYHRAGADDGETRPLADFVLSDLPELPQIISTGKRKTVKKGWSPEEDDQLEDLYIILQTRANIRGAPLSLEPARAFFPVIKQQVLLDRLRHIASRPGEVAYLDGLLAAWYELWHKGHIKDPTIQSAARNGHTTDLLLLRRVLNGLLNKQSLRFQAIMPEGASVASQVSLPANPEDLCKAYIVELKSNIENPENSQTYSYLWSLITSAQKSAKLLDQPFCTSYRESRLAKDMSTQERLEVFKARYERLDKVTPDCAKDANALTTRLLDEGEVEWPLVCEDGDMMALAHLFSDDLVKFSVDTSVTRHGRPYTDYRTRKIVDDDKLENGLTIYPKDCLTTDFLPLFPDWSQAS